MLAQRANLGRSNATPRIISSNASALMPATHLSLHYHIVFSTKDRRPFIGDEWRDRLYEYLGGLIRTADGIAEKIGGTTDHIHILAGLRATHQLATFVQDIKQTSSQWIHETINVKEFTWQQGYGAFTVSVSNCEAVRKYIADQPSASSDENVSGGIRVVPEKARGGIRRKIFVVIFRRPCGTNSFDDGYQPLRGWLMSGVALATKDWHRSRDKGLALLP